jgi:hypothetical protein
VDHQLGFVIGVSVPLSTTALALGQSFLYAETMYPTVGAPSSFAIALKSAHGGALFSVSELRKIGLLCGLIFVLPTGIGLSLSSLSHFNPTQSVSALTANTTQPSSGYQTNDALSLGEHMLSEAKRQSDPTLSQSFMAEAKTQLSQSLAANPTDLTAQRLAAEAGMAVATNTSIPTGAGVIAAPSSSQQIIAAPATSSTTALTTTGSSNSVQGTAILIAGSDSLFVTDTHLRDNTQLYLVPQNSDQNAVIFIKSRQSGVGFTLATTAPISHDVPITWYEIVPQ